MLVRWGVACIMLNTGLLVLAILFACRKALSQESAPRVRPALLVSGTRVRVRTYSCVRSLEFDLRRGGTCR